MSDAKKLSPAVELKMGGEVRKLEYRFLAYWKYELLTGRQLINDLFSEAPTTNQDVIHYIWAGLLRNQKELDFEIEKAGEISQEGKAALRKVAEWIDDCEETQEEVVKAIFRAIGFAVPDRDPEAEAEAEQKNAPKESESGTSGDG